MVELILWSPSTSPAGQNVPLSSRRGLQENVKRLLLSCPSVGSLLRSEALGRTLALFGHDKELDTTPDQTKETRSTGS